MLHRGGGRCWAEGRALPTPTFPQLPLQSVAGEPDLDLPQGLKMGAGEARRTDVSCSPPSGKPLGVARHF